eukprot:TRINITY_DN14879_c0_g1_i1.p1 TRINITY_DN14879_c0_g1~~TRINITY_DN14879_c0_g1_i1.p1  ORF type:complete len:183 (+),score=18.88 TRINITY_DN14879_c0_g1_i1:47-595(+)
MLHRINQKIFTSLCNRRKYVKNWSRTSSSNSDILQRSEAVLSELKKGNRRALAKAITLVESSLRSDQKLTQQLINTILKTPSDNTFRIGLSGSPGVGKSTFIESLGLHILNQNHKVAVLAVDPSSSKTGGSILADKTRMEKLSKQEDAYVRPSPSSGTLGGVTKIQMKLFYYVKCLDIISFW